ncbi:translation initiation factor IF-2, mitochondrial-like [Hyalella azteca]|uniref:Translation initiation factor IF-2, mitochondrial-like n=1 Tax=Hyalella azteca TaxID=294128 RepID=A0A8B7N589_HYAAZ|nr:translation initiation factor IF-2, mitochondrial-like [Hyalella azteca]
MKVFAWSQNILAVKDAVFGSRQIFFHSSISLLCSRSTLFRCNRTVMDGVRFYHKTYHKCLPVFNHSIFPVHHASIIENGIKTCKYFSSRCGSFVTSVGGRTDSVCLYVDCCFYTSARGSSRSSKMRAPIPLKNKAKPVPVKVWKGMTVKQFAAALERDVETVLEIFGFIETSVPFRSRGASVTDVAVLTRASQIAGRRAMVVPDPTAAPAKKSSKDAFRRPAATAAELVPRPPVITIMGHVDHGKTTLLDALRNSKIVDSEFGGITQHIGAFQFSLPSGAVITVLDTPGHAAFSAMRGRGATVTDIVVLVVAADDGVMPQTRESIDHCHRAAVPMVVALNKIDKPDANVERARASLLNAGVQLEDQGGEVQCVEISAKLGRNIPALNFDRQMCVLSLEGLASFCLQVATCLVQRGTLRAGALLVAGTASCRVRVMHDEHEQLVHAAPPSMPVQVAGWSELPSAGDEVLEVRTRARQKEVLAWRLKELSERRLLQDKVIVEAKAQEHQEKYKQQLAEKRSRGIRFSYRLRTGLRPKEYDTSETGPRVAILLKCDVQGSLEAIMQSATIFSFNVSNDRAVEEAIERSSASIVHTNIIYRLVEHLRSLISKKMPTLPQEEVLGEAEVLEQFMASDGGRKKTPVAGCRCVKGSLKKDEKFRLFRDGQLIHEGPLSSMRHVKSEVKTIATDIECGLKFEDRSIQFLKGDRIICYTVHQLEQESDWRPPGF